ncbi:phosphate ABC transporter permease PstA [uncultured Tateyamaria sp.]|uniref:phosphate ABC transporter permease PstA n=1 Tax=uncultured Tateyamaria sp. TaxID=455651 RepID=UPI00260FF9AD|nr:phosphate ABC transporter permease PstA [uncultured Tateyamaria sp.]
MGYGARITRERMSGTDIIVYGILLAALALVFLTYGKIVFDIVMKGIGFVDWGYLTEDPRMSGRAGGVFPIIVSTLWVLSIAVVVAVPISLAIAIFVTEYLSPFSTLSRIFRLSMLILASVPSIAFGLFGATFFAQYLGFGTSILTGGLTLAIMVIPICAFAFEEVFRLLPTGYRNGAFALGARKARFIFFILIPASATDIITVVLLGTGRALAETAALLFTSGYSDRMPESIFDPGRVLSIHIYDLSMGIPGGDRMASASAILLIGLFLIISSVGIFFSRKAKT